MLSTYPIGEGVTLDDGTILPWNLFFETLEQLSPDITEELDNQLIHELRIHELRLGQSMTYETLSDMDVDPTYDNCEKVLDS